MCFPKSHTVVILFLFVCFSNASIYAQELLFKNNDNSNTSCSFNNDRLESLIKNDSLYKATILLNEAINFSKKYNLKSTEAKTYNALGDVLTKMSNYKNAETYHLKALKLYDSINYKKGKDNALSSLANTYLLEKNYKKFDSVYPIAQASSKALNSELYFINLESKIKKHYYTIENESLLKTTEAALKLIDSVDFNSLVFSKTYDIKKLKDRLHKSFKYHSAIAHVKLADHKAKGFDLLLSIDERKLKAALKEDSDSYRKLATYNYYKFIYYTEANKDLDSANKYLLKSDAYKYEALIDFEKRNAKNGELIYNIINTEQQLSLANEIRKKDAATSEIFLMTTILTGLLLITTLTIFYFYFKARKNIIRINKVLKSTNRKLIATDKDRLEFFSILSHELRTPIYGISGLATLIDQEDDKAKRQSYLDSLLSSSSYLSTLIDNILQANKLRFEEKNLRLKPDKISQIVNHVVSTVKVAAKNKGLELKTHIDNSDANEYILIDKVAFSQILINLAYNAIRYTKEGHVSINVLQKNRTDKNVTLRFEVKDTGIGIREEHRSIVFSAFENKAFLNKNSSGSGLGLHIVKTLLKSHNSDIDFISKPNEGSTFFFDITFDLAASPAMKKPMISLPQRDMRVLIVDDNKINLLITKKNIEKIEGYSCETLTNGKEAISMVKEKDFDVILMDINMPEMDGFEVTKHIRMFNPNIPILALTALNSGEILNKAEDIGIDQIITKPYIFEDFKAIVTSYANINQHYFRCIDVEAI